MTNAFICGVAGAQLTPEERVFLGRDAAVGRYFVPAQHQVARPGPCAR